jgi:hypothetical protein
VPEPGAPLVQLGEARRLTLPVLAAPPLSAVRAGLERQTRLLAWVGIGWHMVEFAIALAAGFAAGSIGTVRAGRLQLEHLTLLDHRVTSSIDNEIEESHPSRDDDHPSDDRESKPEHTTVVLHSSPSSICGAVHRA